MSIADQPIMASLKLNRFARLWGKLCLPRFTLEITFLVGTRSNPDNPLFYLETVNLVMNSSKELGGGKAVSSACLPGETYPDVSFDPDTNKLSSAFEISLDMPGIRDDRKEKSDPATDTPGPTAVRTKAELQGRFVGEITPRAYKSQNFEGELKLWLPKEYVGKLDLKETLDFKIKFPFLWFFLTPRKELLIQPVFIAGSGATPPTGSDFYPLLARANEIWAKCCIQFRAKCPIYVDNQNYRVATQAEAIAFKNGVSVGDAIEVFMVEELDPETLWGGGATFSSGTANAKVVSGDNQLPGNDNHMAHELGHVLGLGHPGNAGTLVDSCPGSVMEPSGFFADNPEFQCQFNCRSASNPLLTTTPGIWCLSGVRADMELVASQ
jgi:hypothetical protein